MIAHPFDFEAPTGLAEALRLLAADPDGTRPLSGGMTLVPMMTLGLTAPERLVDLKRVPELGGIREEPDALVIGATTTHHEIATAPLVQEHAPLLAEAATLVGDVQVRNRGTIGGSVAHADPAANYLPALLALDAVIEVWGRRGGLFRPDAAKRRNVPARDFFTGLMTTALAPSEIVGAVRIPKRPQPTGMAFRKFARVKGNFPIVCAAAVVQQDGPLEGRHSAFPGADRRPSGKHAGGAPDGASGKAECLPSKGPPIRVRVAVGGATAVPVLIDLAATPMSKLESAIRSAIDDPMSDANASAEYRIEMATVFARRAVEAAHQALNAEQAT